MKSKIALTALLVVFLSIGISSTASARPWCHRGYGFGFYAPRVRVVVPAPVVVGGYYGGGYYAPAPRCYGGGYYRHYDRDRRGWDHDRGYHRGWR